MEKEKDFIIINKNNEIVYDRFIISWHSLERYLERVGGDLGNMVMDLEQSIIVEDATKRVNKRFKKMVKNFQSQKGYVLFNGKVFFLVKYQKQKYIVITSIAA